MQNIAIIGAGLVGRLLAWQLAERGVQVALFDKDDLSQPRAAAFSAAGMISPLSELAISDTEIYRMGVNSLKRWPDIVKGFEVATGESIPYEHQGSLAVAFGQDMSEMRHFYNDLQYKLGAVEDADWIEQSQIAELEPQLAENFQQGLFLKNEAHIDNRKFLQVSLAAIKGHRNIELIDQCALEVDDERLDEASGYERVIDCRGMGSDIKGLRAVRGEVLHVQCEGISLKRPVRFMHPRYRLYIVPKANNTFVIGATEIESSDQSPISLQSMLELGSALYSLHPAFAEARIIETDVNLRPALMDNNPLIEVDERIIRVNGLYRHGWLIAPEIVADVLAVLDGGEAEYEWLVKENEQKRQTSDVGRRTSDVGRWTKI